MPLFPYGCTRANTGPHTRQGSRGAVPSHGLPAPCLLLLTYANCLALAAAQLRHKAQDCAAQGLFPSSLPLPRLPQSGFPKPEGPELWQGACQALPHPGTHSPVGTGPHHGHGHLPHLFPSGEKKKKIKKGVFGTAPCWMRRVIPMGFREVWGTALAGRSGTCPGPATSKANKWEGSQHSPIALPLFPVCSQH